MPRITAPIVRPSIEGNDCRKNLQAALNLIAPIANAVGDVPTSDLFHSAGMRAIYGHFIDINTTLVNLADDEMPF